MDEGEKILWDAINRIAWGSDDDQPPFKAVPREALIELARKAIHKYRNLTRQSSRPDKCSAESHALKRIGGYSVCPDCDEDISGG